jgi:flagellar L-ring protein precursor FlgH
MPSPVSESKNNDELRGPASNNVVNGDSNKNKEEQKTSQVASKSSTSVASGSVSEDEQPNIAVEAIPTRVVERLVDGNYRVKGVQPFMIGKREYKVIVTGFVRPEDFSDEGVSSNKILDPQWDVVSLRRVQ